MNKIILAGILLLIILTSASLASVPQMISYQGKLTDSMGSPVADAAYPISVALYVDSSTTTPLWGPQSYNVTTKAGLFSMTIGSITNPLPLSAFSGSTYLETKFGTQTFPRQQIICVGYAFRAMEADSAAALKLPYSGSAANSSTLLAITNSGTGKAGSFDIVNSNSSSNALQVSSNGKGATYYSKNTGSGTAVAGSASGTSGVGGFFEVTNASNTSSALSVYTAGGGSAADFTLNTPGSTANALRVTSIGSGSVIHGDTIGTGSVIDAVTYGSGKAGFFQISNAYSSSDALTSITNGTGGAGFFSINNSSNYNPALYASTNGPGAVVNASNSGLGKAGYFETTSGSNADTTLHAKHYGTGTTGYFHASNTSNQSPVLYAKNDGPGTAGYFETTNTSSASPVLYAKSNSSEAKAAQFDGSVQINGKLTGTASGGAIPIAMGVIGKAGELKSVSSNVTGCTYNATSKYYFITISGVSYNTNYYICLVTPSYADKVWPTTSSGTGNTLAVLLYDKDGNIQPGQFSFVVYKL